MAPKERMSSCLCGKMRLKLSGEQKFQVRCHCTICQKLCGSAAHNIAFSSDQVEIAKNDGPWLKYNTSENLQRRFCNTCGVYMMGVLSGDTNIVAIPAGTIDRNGGPNDPAYQPQHHIFYGERINDAHDDLPKWAGFPDESERLG